MIKVELGKNGLDNFFIDDFMESPLEGKATAEWTETSATLSIDENNYVEFTGDFDLGKGHSAKKLSQNTNEITGYTLVLDGEVQFEAKGLSITQDELGDLSTYAKYLNKSSYEVNGNDKNNDIQTSDANDKLFGLDGNDDLKAFGGNDLLDGGKGKDKMDGGDGNDVYLVDNKSDKVIEGKNAGADTVKSKDVDVDLSKLSNVEDIFLFGKGKLDATGNKLANNIEGNDGNNDIEGGLGNDHLTGGKGSDTFIFSKRDGEDTITDFDARGKDQDLIDLDGFGGKFKFKNIDVEAIDKNTTLIDLGSGTEIILEGVKAKDIDASDFLF